MVFIVYYDPELNERAQWFVPPGEPIDQLASTLGIIELSQNQFINVPMAPGSPPAPDWDYDGASSRPPSSPVTASWELVAHGSSGAGKPANVTLDTTGATVLVAVGGAYAATQPSVVSDNFGNTWIAAENTTASGSCICMAYCAGGTVGASHVISYNGPYGALCVLAFSGGPMNPFDQSVVGYGTAGLPLSPGSITPSTSNALLVTGLSVTQTVDAIDQGFTIVEEQDFVGGVTMAAAIAYLIANTPAAVAPTWTFSGGAVVDAAAAMVCFKG